MNALIEATATPGTADAILSTLLSEAGNERRRQTLMRLKAACDELVKSGRPLKLSDLQRAVQLAHGPDAGPKAQSISNERTKPLGMHHYVEAREREAQAARVPKRKAGVGRFESALTQQIDQIRDIDLRSALHDLHDRCLLAEAAYKRAKVMFKMLQPGADMDAVLDGRAALVASGGPAFSSEDVAALHHLVRTLTDDTKLAAVGLTIENNRVRRKTGTRDELVGPAVLVAVVELAKRLG